MTVFFFRKKKNIFTNDRCKKTYFYTKRGKALEQFIAFSIVVKMYIKEALP